MLKIKMKIGDTVFQILETFLAGNFGFSVHIKTSLRGTPRKYPFRCHNIQINGQGDGDCTSKINGKSWCYIIGSFIPVQVPGFVKNIWKYFRVKL